MAATGKGKVPFHSSNYSFLTSPTGHSTKPGIGLKHYMEPNLDHLLKIASELTITIKQVEATASLLDEGATVPFISRYRKEATGSLDEVQIAAIRDRMEQLRELDKRRESILKSIRDQEKLTPELEARIMAAETMAVLEADHVEFRVDTGLTVRH